MPNRPGYPLRQTRQGADTCEKWIERKGKRKVGTVHLDATH